MKKTVTINISGIIFNIDEDAYNKLQKYLEDINSRFSNKDEGKEIVADIEARIAELFSGKISSQKQVITLEDVDEMIAVMGNPSDFGGEELHEKETESDGSNSDKSWKSKRIYRDPEHRVLGGVCGGLGLYFNLDPVIFRILMVVTFFAFGPLLYIILWIAVPKARTTAQKLEMQGKKVNISNIEKNIKEEFEEVKQNFKKMKDDSSFKNGANFIEKLGHVFLVVVSAIVKVVVAFFGVILIIIGLALLFAFLSTFIFGLTDFSIGNTAVSFSKFVEIFTDKQDISLFLITLILVTAIPILSIIYAGVKLIFKIKSGNRYIGITVAAFWFLSLIYLIVFVAGEARQFKYTGASRSTIIADQVDTLVIKTTQITNADNDDQFIQFDESEIKVIDGKPVMTGRPRITIEKNDSNNITYTIKKKARGATEKEARENAGNVNYVMNENDITNCKKEFVFESVYNIKKGAKWRFPRVEITLKVPVGKVLVIDKNMAELLYSIENYSQLSDEDIAGKTWVMKQEGLVLVK